MVIRDKVDIARQLLDTAQTEGDIFGKVANSLTYWIQKYADTRAAWYHGILHHLEDWMKENEESTDPSLARDPEMATAIGEFVERMMD